MNKISFLRDLILMQISRQQDESAKNSYCRNCLIPAVNSLLIKHSNNSFVIEMVKICYDTNIGHGRSKSAERIIFGLQNLNCEELEKNCKESAFREEEKFHRDFVSREPHKRSAFCSTQQKPTHTSPTFEDHSRLRSRGHVHSFK